MAAAAGIGGLSMFVLLLGQAGALAADDFRMCSRLATRFGKTGSARADLHHSYNMEFITCCSLACRHTKALDFWIWLQSLSNILHIRFATEDQSLYPRSPKC